MASGKRSKPIQASMQLSEADIVGMNEALLIRALEIQWEIKHKGVSLLKCVKKVLGVGRSTYIQARSGKGYLGMAKMLEFQKLCESDLVTRFIASKQ